MEIENTRKSVAPIGIPSSRPRYKIYAAATVRPRAVVVYLPGARPTPRCVFALPEPLCVHTASA